MVTDFSDPFLEGAKAVQYMGFQKIADVLFAIFAVVFLILRLIIFPYVALFPAFYYATGLPGTTFLQLLLIVLQLMFFWWSYVILKIAFGLVTGGKAEDIRDEE